MRTRSFASSKGILYLVATPIGNLGDFSYRAIETLKTVDKIYAEDTRNSITLLRHYNITTPLESYHEFNQDTKTDVVVEEQEFAESKAASGQSSGGGYQPAGRPEPGNAGADGFMSIPEGIEDDLPFK